MISVDLLPQSTASAIHVPQTAVEPQNIGFEEQSAAFHARLNGVLQEAPASPGSLQEHYGPLAAIELRKSVLESELAELRSHALSLNSQRGYAADWRHFSAWCAGQGSGEQWNSEPT